MRAIYFFPLVLAAVARAALGQGSLTPPGAPAPTMKTLAQVEPRIPIPGGTAGFSASASGSYYLTGNLTVAGTAINIAADNVSLDLCGYTVASAAGGGDIVRITAPNGGNVAVYNGQIRGQTTYANGSYTYAGFNHGVVVATTGAVRIADLTVSNVDFDGIRVSGGEVSIGLATITLPGGAAVISHCAVNVAGQYGINCDGQATLDHCSAAPCAGTALLAPNATVSDCYGKGTGMGAAGVDASVVSNCIGESNSGTGIKAANAATGCKGSSTSGAGLTAAVAANCTGSSSTGPGLVANAATNCRGQTTGMNSTSYGIDCNGGTASGCYGVAAANTAFALRAQIAIGCILSGGGQSPIANKYNMP